MSLAGFKKQLNKANQYVTEKIGGAEGTKLDEDYLETEKKVDAIIKLLDEMVTHTHEYLQPNPAYRAKLLTMNTLNKLQGKSKTSSSCPQPESLLGDCMLKNATALGSDSCFAQCLTQTGDAFKYLGDIKYTMEDHVKEKFLNHIHNLQIHDIKEINHHRKKLEGRRLDFDCKKRKQDRSASAAKMPEDELAVAEEKFQESKILTEQAMVNFLNSEVEQIQALTEFVTAQVDYHRQATDIMEQLQKFLIDKKDEAAVKPKVHYEPKRISGLNTPQPDRKNTANNVMNNAPANNNISAPHTATPPVSSDTDSNAVSANVPSCRAMYDFEAENDSELPFAEGDVIQLIQKVDEHWFEGKLNGRRGFFPISYVEVINPLP